MRLLFLHRTRAKIDKVFISCYSLRMKASGFLLGSTLTAALGVGWKVVKFLAEWTGKAIYYFGLYYPLLYAIYGVLLYFIFGLNPFDLTTDGRLYIFGFALSVVACVITAVKNLIVKPYRKYFKKTDIIEYGKDDKLSKHAPEAPKIYKSKSNPGYIVYEYENRYDLYEETDDGVRYASTEYKSVPKRRRW